MILSSMECENTCNSVFDTLAPRILHCNELLFSPGHQEVNQKGQNLWQTGQHLLIN